MALPSSARRFPSRARLRSRSTARGSRSTGRAALRRSSLTCSSSLGETGALTGSSISNRCFIEGVAPLRSDGGVAGCCCCFFFFFFESVLFLVMLMVVVVVLLLRPFLLPFSLPFSRRPWHSGPPEALSFVLTSLPPRTLAAKNSEQEMGEAVDRHHDAQLQQAARGSC